MRRGEAAIPVLSEERVLVVGPAWVGDMVMSHTLYRLLKRERPQLRLDVLAPAWSRPLLDAMPEVDSAIDMPMGHGELGLRARYRLGKALRERAYRQAIVLPNSFKSALVPWFAGIEQRTGWRGEYRYGLLNDLRRLDENRLPMLVQRYAALGCDPGASLPEPLPLPRLQDDPGRLASIRSRLSLSDAPLLALCPGAGFGSAKRWPAAHFGELARRYLASGWQVLLLGSAADGPCCDQAWRAAGSSPACHNLAGRSTLPEAIALIAASGAVVSNDSGLMHVAAALGRPLVALFGPTPVTFTPPLSDRARALVSDLPCAPCGKRECPLRHQRCLADRGVDEVDGCLRQVLTA